MDKVLVIDFGSQYCKIIARKVRELGIYSEVHPANKSNIIEIAKDFNAIIFSGGPSSVYDKNALTIPHEIFDLNKPILAICYGMQLVHHMLGGKVEKLSKGEYGKVELVLENESSLVNDIPHKSIVWMSHFDTVTKLAPGFELIGKTNISNAITSNKEKNIYTLQFHAEVTHTEFGLKMLENFLFEISKLNQSWVIKDVVKNKIEECRKIVDNRKVILGLSGGVDSSVLAVLLHKSIGSNLIPIFIDNGLMRKNEALEVKNNFENKLGIKLHMIDASKEFYKSLEGVVDPEQKRKIIGRVFIEQFTKAKKQFSDAHFLAQGTIYPDLIESSGVNGVAHVIKSHHNVGGLPDEIEFEILEPLKDLFKDEVRSIGLELGLDKEIVYRHPFPGPGLGIRIIGDITLDKVKILQDVDDIYIRKLKELNIYNKISQAAAILTPVRTVGVQGDERTYNFLVALRAIETSDFMTANFSKIDFDILDEIASEIISNVKEVNRVVYDITSKPPATIEWE